MRAFFSWTLVIFLSCSSFIMSSSVLICGVLVDEVIKEEQERKNKQHMERKQTRLDLHEQHRPRWVGYEQEVESSSFILIMNKKQQAREGLLLYHGEVGGVLIHEVDVFSYRSSTFCSRSG